MTEGDSAEKLSAKREFVIVVRLVVGGGGTVTGELMDPVSDRRRRFTDVDNLIDGIRRWADDAVGKVLRDDQ
jgi:hypothetical protein